MSEKMYSLDEFDEATLAQFNEGTLHGMYQCHEIISDTLTRFKQSLDDVWAITYQGLITPEKKELTDKIVFAQDTLAVLEDMFQDFYFEKLDSLKGEMSTDE